MNIQKMITISNNIYYITEYCFIDKVKKLTISATELVCLTGDNNGEGF